MLSVGPLMRSGQIKRAAEVSARASDLDPLAFQHAMNALVTNLFLRNYDLAERYLDRFTVLYPAEWPMGYVFRAHVALKRDGHPETAREIFERAEERSGVDYWNIIIEPGPPASPMSLKRVLCTQDPDACRLATARAVRDSFLVRLHDAYLRLAELYHWAGDESISRVYYDSAATATSAWLEEVSLNERPGAERSMQMRTYRAEGRLALIHAALGNEAAALHHIEKRQELKPIVADRWVVLTERDFTSEAYVKLGDYDAALAELESRLSTPSDWSVPLLRVDPFWDPLRDDPRFQALLERYGGD
jgi:tetratricopeptide (TPR) repeat protein